MLTGPRLKWLSIKQNYHTKTIDRQVEITFGYEDMNKVMKVVRDFNAEIKERPWN
ncbi:MAG: hypothetical protein U5K51_13425 [Flavobacteriaceae bacterium]|nr:hypothetical protein [Flavobacteriaceae bacterium]